MIDVLDIFFALTIWKFFLKRICSAVVNLIWSDNVEKMELGLQKISQPQASHACCIPIFVAVLWHSTKPQQEGPCVLSSPSVWERWVRKFFCTTNSLHCHWTVSNQVSLDHCLQICCAWVTDSRLECACRIWLSNLLLDEALWLLIYFSYYGQLTIAGFIVM